MRNKENQEVSANVFQCPLCLFGNLVDLTVSTAKSMILSVPQGKACTDGQCVLDSQELSLVYLCSGS